MKVNLVRTVDNFLMFDNNINQPEVHLFNFTSYERQFIYMKVFQLRVRHNASTASMLTRRAAQCSG